MDVEGGSEDAEAEEQDGGTTGSDEMIEEDAEEDGEGAEGGSDEEDGNTEEEGRAQ